jgi:hypothetical protein
MIIGKLFEGDRSDLAYMQHDVYSESLVVIMDAACSRLRAAQRVLNTEMELLDRINHKSFDHRTIQYFHDAIAGQFRYEYCIEADLSSVSKEPRSLWREFLGMEIERLLDHDPLLAKMLATAAFFPNPDSRGKLAEEYLCALAIEEYPNLSGKGVSL